MNSVRFFVAAPADTTDPPEIPIHPVWFDHNALYHVVQAAAFVLLYQGVSGEE